jgi:glucose/arabinose dehydrogenase
MLKIALVAALVCAAACKDKKKETESQPAAKTPEAPPPTPTPTPAPPPAVLKIEAAKLTIQRAKQAKKNPDDPDGLALEASGDVKVDTKVVAKVTPDGKLADATGKTVATMTADAKSPSKASPRR